MVRRAILPMAVLAGVSLGGLQVVAAGPVYEMDVAPSHGEPADAPCRPDLPEWAERLSLLWRQEYMVRRVSQYLFQRPDFMAGSEEGSRDSPSGEPLASPIHEAGLEHWCERADAYLAAGRAPESLAYFNRCSPRDAPHAGNALRPALGALKANLMMARTQDARHSLSRLRAEGMLDDNDPLVGLLQGILAGMEGDWQAAAAKLLKAFPAWRPGANVEALAGYALLRQERYRDAINVLRVAAHSPWGPVRDFALLGLADAERGLARCEEAEAIVGRLCEACSPLGILGLAEHRIAQGDLEGALEALEALDRTDVDEYWRGVALAYGVHLCAEKGAWEAAEELAARSRYLVIARPWQEHIRRVALRALERLVEEQAAPGGDPAALVLLAERWQHLVPALPAKSRMVLARAYEGLGLATRADRVDPGLEAAPERLYESAWAAWASGNYDRAQQRVDRLLEIPGHARAPDARLLEACLLYPHKRFPEAAKRLADPGGARDPRVMEAAGDVAAALDMPSIALDLYRRALEHTGPDPAQRRRLNGVLAVQLYRQGHHEESVEQFRKAEEGAADAPPAAGKVLGLLRLQQVEQASQEVTRFNLSGDRRLLEELAAADLLAGGAGGGTDAR